MQLPVLEVVPVPIALGPTSDVEIVANTQIEFPGIRIFSEFPCIYAGVTTLMAGWWIFRALDADVDPRCACVTCVFCERRCIHAQHTCKRIMDLYVGNTWCGVGMRGLHVQCPRKC